MRLALISDIHSNLEALKAVLDDIDTQSITETVCLGDIVGYGVNPNECVELVKGKCPIILLGNHDAAAVGLLSTHHFNIHAKIAIEWTVETMKKGPLAFLHSLPLREVKDSATLVHATPYEPNMWYYITSLEEAVFNFQFFETQFCFIGHTHIPIIIVLDNEKELYVHQDAQIDYSAMNGSRFLVNVGSVGQPRDRDPRACYGILDTDKKVFSLRRIEYDVAKTQASMRKFKMPEFLIARLSEGR
jgi:diadenosine tetraphosphatase ApaH/serine/threonine PP2A family protein phosphatase